MPRSANAALTRSASLVGLRRDSEIQPVLQQRTELRAQQPPLGEHRAVLLHVRLEARLERVRRQHNGLAEHRAALRPAEVERIGQRRKIAHRHVVLFRAESVAEPRAVDEQIHPVCSAHAVDCLQLRLAVKRADSVGKEM